MAAKELSLRGKAARERIERIKNSRPPGGVRVTPASDELRKVLRHPRGARFPNEGSAEWPNDRFTKRRLAEGAVKLEQAEKKTSRGRHAESAA